MVRGKFFIPPRNVLTRLIMSRLASPLLCWWAGKRDILYHIEKDSKNGNGTITLPYHQ